MDSIRPEQVEVEVIEAPEQAPLISEETVSEQVNRKVRHYEKVNLDYEEMQKKKAKLKRGEDISKSERELPEIAQTDAIDDDAEMLSRKAKRYL